MAPLVSCIMPTRNRREFVPGAIDCWMSQSYVNKELVVLDSGDDPIEDLVPIRHDIQYVYVTERPLRTGRARNIACEMAKGSLIAHFDDDDWSHPLRLAEQVRMLTSHQLAVTGYYSMAFMEDASRKAWMFTSAMGDAYALGTSLLYVRDFWRANQFPDVVMGEDGHFVSAAYSQSKLISTQDAGRIVARVHAGNTSEKFTDDEQWASVLYETVQSWIQKHTCSSKH